MQEAILFNWALAWPPWQMQTSPACVDVDTTGSAVSRGAQVVGNIFWQRMLGANVCNAAFRCFACFGKRIVPGIKVFPFLERLDC